MSGRADGWTDSGTDGRNKVRTNLPWYIVNIMEYHISQSNNVLKLSSDNI